MTPKRPLAGRPTPGAPLPSRSAPRPSPTAAEPTAPASTAAATPPPRKPAGKRAGLIAAALVPYAALKTAWALGATPGFTGAGRPGADPECTSDPGIRLYDRGVDVTAVLAVLGMLLALGRAPLL